MRSDINFGMNRNKSDWFGMNFNPKLLLVKLIRRFFNHIEINSNFSYDFENTAFEKQFKAITVKGSVQQPGNFVSMI